MQRHAPRGAPVGVPRSESARPRDVSAPVTSSGAASSRLSAPAPRNPAPQAALGTVSALSSPAPPAGALPGPGPAAGTASGGGSPVPRGSDPPLSPGSPPARPSWPFSCPDGPGSCAAGVLPNSLTGETAASTPAGKAAARSCLKSGPGGAGAGRGGRGASEPGPAPAPPQRPLFPGRGVERGGGGGGGGGEGGGGGSSLGALTEIEFELCGFCLEIRVREERAGGKVLPRVKVSVGRAQRPPVSREGYQTPGDPGGLRVFGWGQRVNLPLPAPVLLRTARRGQRDVRAKISQAPITRGHGARAKAGAFDLAWLNDRAAAESPQPGKVLMLRVPR